MHFIVQNDNDHSIRTVPFVAQRRSVFCEFLRPHVPAHAYTGDVTWLDYYRSNQNASVNLFYSSVYQQPILTTVYNYISVTLYILSCSSEVLSVLGDS